MQQPSSLHDLAAVAGIVPSYVDQSGTETRTTSDSTRVALLRAMGIDASTDDHAGAALGEWERRDRSRVLSPVRVVRRDDPELAAVLARAPEGTPNVAWTLELVPETGEPVHASGEANAEPDGGVRISLPGAPPLGYHTLRVTLRTGSSEQEGKQTLIVVPGHCPSVAEVAGQERVFGVIANLYSVRSAENWGIGDTGDLARLAEWTAEIGGAFLGVNPLHALRNQGADISPYSPVSRIFRNAIYIDVPGIPEYGASDEAKRMVEAARAELEELRTSDHVQYEPVMALKRRVLEVLYRSFAAGGGERAEAYRAYLEAQGESLTHFATFEALTGHLESGDWRTWPDDLRDPRSPAVAEFARTHAEEIDFHRWLQFELDRQLAEAAARGEGAGLSIGLYQDLAIGTSPAGADVWANPHLFVTGASIGAPPDAYSAEGQNWGLPPLDPRALREDAYRYWVRLVRASMRHAGALRIDHAIGLFRQFWIPEGAAGKDGAYVSFPVEDLLGILALEADRHRALVVGEDLGTVPPEVPPVLRRWGVLSSRVFYFEREGDEFRPAAEYEPMSLATANTHDMPTLAGFWRGRDIEVKREVGVIPSDEAAEEQRRDRVQERRAILERLAAEGVLPSPEHPGSGAALRGAVHAFLSRTPAALVGLSLDDLVGEAEPVNVPGVPPSEFSAWTRKLATPIEDLARDPRVRDALPDDERKLSAS
ncbi:MAG TPA: 4-alpha-glucanotransferase [Longimicrobium sp.]|jgi:4-alpha-glucanotransferase